MKKFFLVSLGVLSLLLITGCAKEVGRVSMRSLESHEQSAVLEKTKPVSLWVDLDVTYYDTFGLTYAMEVTQNKKIIFNGSCDALDINVKMFSTKVVVGSKASVKYLGKMKCSFTPPESGEVVIKATPVPQGDTQKTELRKFDIIVKQ